MKGKEEKGIRIEYLPLNSLKRWPRNPKDHDVQSIYNSFFRFGYVEPILINETTGMIMAGHGRLDTLLHRKKAGEPPPDRIMEKDGDWMVPVIRGVELSEKEAEAYAIASNRTVELGGWKEADLLDVLKDHADNLAGVGYDEADISLMAARLDGNFVPEDEGKGGSAGKKKCPQCGYEW